MKRTIVIIAALFFFVCALIYVNAAIFSPKDSAREQAEDNDRVTSTLSDPMADSDGDGLLNYEEQMYNTSAKHADSDGDGVSDGQEVALGTDPTVYGNVSQAIEIRHEETLGYEFVQTSNPRSYDEIVEGLRGVSAQAQYSDTGDITLPGVGQESANAATDNANQARLRGCANQLASVLQNTLVTGANDSATISAYLRGENQNTYPITRMLESAEYATEALPRVYQNNECPMFTTARDEFEIVYAQQIEILTSILGSNASTTEQNTAWASYGENIVAWMDVVVDIRQTAAAAGVVFSPDEPGYMFSGAATQ